MSAAHGLAGSTQAEVEGIYVSSDLREVQFFLDGMLDEHPHGLDLWEITLTDAWMEAWHGRPELKVGPHGFEYLPVPVPRHLLRLLRSFDSASRSAFAGIRQESPDGHPR